MVTVKDLKEKLIKLYERPELDRCFDEQKLNVPLKKFLRAKSWKKLKTKIIEIVVDKYIDGSSKPDAAAFLKDLYKRYGLNYGDYTDTALLKLSLTKFKETKRWADIKQDIIIILDDSVKSYV